MNSIRKWLYKPKKTDQSLLAQFFYADEDLITVAAELDSFDGRKDPSRCTALVNHLRQCQDKVLSICQMIMDEVIPEDRALRDFRAKFPDDVLQENLAGQLWFGAECLSAGSNILNREVESASMRPLAKALTKSLENVRNLLREQCFRNPPEFTEKICESLKILDRLFSEFELSYVSAMVPVKSVHEYEAQLAITVLFSETLQRALKLGLLCQDQVDSCDPALMFTIPRLAIVSGLLIFPDGPLCLDRGELSDMFRPFRSLLQKIRELLWTLNRSELGALERALCSVEETYIGGGGGDLVDPHDDDESTMDTPSTTTTTTELESLNNRNSHSQNSTVTRNHHNSSSHRSHSHQHFHHHHHHSSLNHSPHHEISMLSSSTTDAEPIASHAIQDYLDQFYKDFPQCKDFILDLSHTSSNQSPTPTTTTGTSLPQEEDEEEGDEERLEEDSTNDNSPPPALCCLSIQQDSSEQYSTDCQLQQTQTAQGNFNLHNNNQSPDLTCTGIVDEEKPIQSYGDISQSFLEDSNSPTTSSSLSLPSSSPKCKVKSKSINEGQEEPETDEQPDVVKMCRRIENPPKIDSPLEEEFLMSVGSGDGDECLGVVESLETKPVSQISSSSQDSGLSSMAEGDVVVVEGTEVGSPSTSISNTKDHHQHLKKSSLKVQFNLDSNCNETDSVEVPTNETRSGCQIITIVMNANRIRSSSSVNQDASQQCSGCVTSSDPCSSTLGVVSSTCEETLSFDSECQDDMEIALAMQAAEIASRNEVRARFKSSSDLIHRLFICISGVADQLQTNYAADLRSTLKCVFAMNATPSEFEEENVSIGDGDNSGLDVTPEPSLDEEHSQSVEGEALSFSSLLQEGHDHHHHHHSQIVHEASPENSAVEVIAPPTWVPDELAPHCMACSASFTVVRRRHHCRNCGKVFCGKCSSNSVPLPRFGHLKPVRVCNRCFMYSVTPFTLPSSTDS